MLKVNTIYFSPTETTKKIMTAVAQGIGNQIHEKNITLPEFRTEPCCFTREDLVIVGVPVYGGRVPGFLREYFKSINGNGTNAVCIALYGNRDYDDALLELKDLMESQGFNVIAGGAFIGEHTYTSKVASGRPDKKDISIALKFGKSIKEKINGNISNEITIKGNYPYKEGMPSSNPIAPVTDCTCVQCKVCAENCPMGAIHFDDCTVVEPEKCIRCCSCVKRCPNNSKSFTHEMIANIVKRLEDNFSNIRKEPELFI